MALSEKIPLAILGRVLQVIGMAFYLGGASISIVIVMAADKVASARTTDETVALGLAILMGGLLAYGILRLGHSIFLYGKKLLAKNRALQVMRSLSRDARPPVLYLRSFVDDRITSDTPTAHDVSGVHLPTLSTEEEHLARAIGDIGPFVAIANPREESVLPHLGATRINADAESWQSTVIGLMSRAQMIVFRVGDGLNLWWEIERAVEIAKPERLLFLIPNNEATLQTFRQKLQPLILCDVPDLVSEMQMSSTIGAILYFNSDGSPCLSPLKDAKFRASNSQPLRPMLRIALKPIFAQLNLKWTPPPIPIHIIVYLLVCTWGLLVCLYWLNELPPWVLLKDFKFERIYIFLLVFYSLALIAPLVVTSRGFVKYGLSLYRALTQFSSPDDTTNEAVKGEKTDSGLSGHSNSEVTAVKIDEQNP